MKAAWPVHLFKHISAELIGAVGGDASSLDRLSTGLESLKLALQSAEDHCAAAYVTGIQDILTDLRQQSSAEPAADLERICQAVRSLEKMKSGKDPAQARAAPGAAAAMRPLPRLPALPERIAAVASTTELDREIFNLLTDFLDEGMDQLDRAEQILLGLEKSGLELEEIHKLFRILHTTKGVASFIGLHQITHLAHITETLVDLLRQGGVDLSAPIIALLFDSFDALGQGIAALRRSIEQQEEIAPIDNLPSLHQRFIAAIAPRG